MSKNKLFVLMAAFVAIVITVGFYSFGNDDRLSTASSISTPTVETDAIPGMTTGANMPVYSYHGGGMSFSRNDTGWVYVVGGDLTGSGTLTTKNDRYNVTTNTWTTMAPYPTAPGIWYTSGASIGTYGFIIGGLTGGSLANTTTQCTRYDFNANTWTVMAPMPQARAMLRGVGYQDSLVYVAGGFNSSGASQVDVFLYNNISNSWRPATSLPQSRMGGAFSRSGDTLVFVNGTSGTFNGTVQLTTYVGVISQSDRASITWTTGAPYPGAGRYRQDAQMWGCKGIVISGGTSAAGYTPAVGDCYVYSPGANAWTIQPNLITTRTAHVTGSVRLGGGVWKFVNVCGFNGANVLTTDILTDTLCPAPSGIVTTICRNGINVAVPDNSPNGARDTIKMLGNVACPILDINVKIDTFPHTWISDMQFSLTHNGTTNVNLFLNRGGSGDNIIGCTFNDSAANPISAGTPPFTGSFRPEQPLTAYNGQNAAGNWVVFMVDQFAGDLGFLKAWCIQFMYSCPTGGVITKEVPYSYKLSQNYPNPFNPTTTIKFGLPKYGQTKLVVFDILGRVVTTLVDEFKDAGTYEVNFDATNLSSGVYFYTLQSGDFKATKKMLLVK